jgi:hypothetical protein
MAVRAQSQWELSYRLMKKRPSFGAAQLLYTGQSKMASQFS